MCTTEECISSCFAMESFVSIISSWSNVSFRDVISLLIFCLDDLYLSNSGVFRSLTRTVFRSFSPLILLVLALHILRLPDWEHRY